jgi:hypothetical protein
MQDAKRIVETLYGVSVTPIGIPAPTRPELFRLRPTDGWREVTSVRLPVRRGTRQVDARRALDGLAIDARGLASLARQGLRSLASAR